jgi:hypothetical protein
MWQRYFFLGKVGWGEIDRNALCRQCQTGGMQRRLHPLAALGHGLVRKPDDLHPDLAGSDHYLNLYRHSLNTLKCNRPDPRDHPLPLFPQLPTSRFTTLGGR